MIGDVAAERLHAAETARRRSIRDEAEIDRAFEGAAARQTVEIRERIVLGVHERGNHDPETGLEGRHARAADEGPLRQSGAYRNVAGADHVVVVEIDATGNDHRTAAREHPVRR